MKKILYFHHAISLGGAPRSLAFLIAGLNRTEFQPIVVMPKRRNNEQVKQQFLHAGAEVIEEVDVRPFDGSTVSPANTLRERAYAIGSLLPLVQCARRLVKTIQPDVVHLNSTCLVGAAIGTQSHAPTVPIIAHVREPLLVNRWGRLLAGMNRRYVDHFISIDETGLKSIGNGHGTGTVIYNFVNRDTFDAEAIDTLAVRTKLGLTARDIVFLSVSRVSASNGALELANLIEAADDQLHPDAKFVVAGFRADSSGDDYAAEAHRRLSAHKRCLALEFVSDVVPLFAAADIIVAPFVTPHSARSVLEGAWMGKPGLVTRQPNLIELILPDESGLVFDLPSPPSFVSSVNRLCDPAVRRDFSNAASAFAKSNFSAERNVERTAQVYRRLLNGEA